MPMTMPRTTRVRPMNRQPSQIGLGHRGGRDRARSAAGLADLAQRVDGERGDHEGGRVEVERQVDLAAGRVGEVAGGDRPSALLTSASTTKSSAAIGAVPYVVSRLYWLACSSLSGGTRFGTDASLAGVQNSEAQEARNCATYIQVSLLAKPSDRFSGMDRYRTARSTSPTIMFIRRSSRSATAPASGPSSRAGSSEVSQTPPTAALCAAAALPPVSAEASVDSASRLSQSPRLDSDVAIHSRRNGLMDSTLASAAAARRGPEAHVQGYPAHAADQRVWPRRRRQPRSAGCSCSGRPCAGRCVAFLADAVADFACARPGGLGGLGGGRRGPWPLVPARPARRCGAGGRRRGARRAARRPAAG